MRTRGSGKTKRRRRRRNRQRPRIAFTQQVLFRPQQPASRRQLLPLQVLDHRQAARVEGKRRDAVLICSFTRSSRRSVQEVGLHLPPTMSLTRSKVHLTRSKVQRLRDEVPKAAVEGSKRTHHLQEDQPRLHLSPFVHPLTCSHPHQQLLPHQGRRIPFFCLNINYFYFRERTPTPLQPRDLSQRSQSPDPPPADVDEKESVRAQLLQVLNQSSNIGLNFPPRCRCCRACLG